MTVEELNIAITTLSETLTAEIEQIKAALDAKVPPDVDLSAEIASLNALSQRISEIIPEVNPEDPML